MSLSGFSNIFRDKLMLALTKVEQDGDGLALDRKTRYWLIGNGGSAAVAQHIATDLVKQSYMAVALTNPAVLTMVGNDDGYAYSFSQQTGLMCGKDDVLIAISSSGRSQNILNACRQAKHNGAQIITLTGMQPDNPLRSPQGFYVPSKNYGIVEIAHLAILHSIVNPGL